MKRSRFTEEQVITILRASRNETAFVGRSPTLTPGCFDSPALASLRRGDRGSSRLAAAGVVSGTGKRRALASPARSPGILSVAGILRAEVGQV